MSKPTKIKINKVMTKKYKKETWTKENSRKVEWFNLCKIACKLTVKIPRQNNLTLIGLKNPGVKS